jgi:transcriptional regulator with XRE-family HTH domain
MLTIDYIPSMDIGFHIMAWRRRRHLTQAGLARATNLSRPYLSRLEKGKADPALSSLRRIAMALDITIGQLVEQLPPEQILSRDAMDRLARGALRPGTREARTEKGARVLALLNRQRRQALGFYKPRGKQPAASARYAAAVNAARWLRASLGEKQWRALLQRIDKLASLERRSP